MRKIAAKIYDLLNPTGIWRQIMNDEQLARLSVNKGIEEFRKEYACKYIEVGIVLVIITALCSILSWIMTPGQLVEERYIERPGEYQLQVNSEDLEYPVDIQISVSETKLEGKSLDTLFEKAYEYIAKNFLGENESAEHVTKKLVFMESIPDTAIRVSWEESDFEYLYENGELRTSRIEEPQIVELVAKLTYFDEIRILSFYVRLEPIVESEKDKFVNLIKSEIDSRDKGNPTSSRVELPMSVDGKNISWSEKQSDTYLKLILIGLIGLIGLFLVARNDLTRKEKERQVQMVKNYPNLISRLIMLLTAGMTCKRAVEYLANLYERNKRNSAKPDYTYEELSYTLKEMEYGISEANAYEAFGLRCGIPLYRRLGTLLSSNLRRGNRDLLNILELEATDAFAERKVSVQKQAEELGTKLLLPMMIMLCLVIAIIIVPAFRSFDLLG